MSSALSSFSSFKFDTLTSAVQSSWARSSGLVGIVNSGVDILLFVSENGTLTSHKVILHIKTNHCTATHER